MQLMILLVVAGLLFSFFPFAAGFVEAAALNLRRFWWIVLLIVLIIWVNWTLGKRNQ